MKRFFKAYKQLYRVSIICIMVFCLMLLIGCSNNSASDNNVKVLYKVTDATGTTLTFSEKPKRIVSLNLSADEILLEVVDHKRLTALSRLVDDPTISSATEQAKDVAHRCNATNMEAVLALQPDLVILPNYNMQPVVTLRNTGAKVFVADTPKNMEGIFRYVETISEAVGEKDKGLALTQKMKQQIQGIQAKVDAKVPEDKKLRVLCMSFTGPIGSIGTFSELCKYAGVKNALEGVDIPYQANLSEEKMLEINPDMIITPSWDYSKQGDPEMFRQRILNNPLYKNINAIKNKKVTRIHDQYMYSTSQYTVKAVEEIAAAAYPEIFNQ